MKAKQSPLEFIEFVVLESSLRTIHPEDPAKFNMRKALKQLPVDIDFKHKFASDKKDEFQVIVNVQVNKEEKTVPGYALDVLCAGYFRVNNPTALKPSHLQNLRYFSSLNFLINKARFQLEYLTHNAPYGLYTLPAIDVGHLFEEKRKQQEAKA